MSTQSRISTITRAGGGAVGVLVIILMSLATYLRMGVQSTPARAATVSAQVKQTAQQKTSVASVAKTQAATIHLAATRSSASVGTLETVLETLNNCGPASVSSVFAYWHIYLSQAQIQSVLRADDSYWGMSPVDLPAYAQSLGMRALVAYGGTEKLIKLLIANGFPVIASQYVSSSYQIRHYRPIEAYNDQTGVFVSADPYLGAGHIISYSEFNAIWAESDYRFQVIYPPSHQALLNAVLRAAGWNATRTYSGAIGWEEAQMQSSDFNTAGSWIWNNGYADVAFDEAQLGEYRKAAAALATATRQGVSSVLISWVREDIQLLQQKV